MVKRIVVGTLKVIGFLAACALPAMVIVGAAAAYIMIIWK